MKIQVPDGQGGLQEVEAEAVTHDQKVDAEKQAVALERQYVEEAVELAELLLKFDFGVIQERGLAKEHRVFAAALYCMDLRETYPDGVDAFDAIARQAAEYYDAAAKRR